MSAEVRVDFYHLVASPLERVLPRIAERVVADGGRLLIVAEAAGARGGIDRMLWAYEPASFLPHGQAGGEHDADQPVLIGEDCLAAANGARNVAIVDGRWRDGALGYERAFHFFDAGHLDDARAAWRALAARDGVTPRYWKQDERGRWTQAA